MVNPNNVTVEASPVTTVLELEAGKQLCRMLGYRLEEGQVLPGFPGETEPAPGPGERMSWGTSPAAAPQQNLESLRAVRNLKFYPLSLLNAMAPSEPLDFIASTFRIATCSDPYTPKLFAQCSTWELLNLTVDTTLDIPEQLYRNYGITSAYLERAWSGTASRDEIDEFDSTFQAVSFFFLFDGPQKNNTTSSRWKCWFPMPTTTPGPRAAPFSGSAPRT